MVQILTKILPPASLIYSILAIELMLKWNNVSNVYTLKSTGQLIPFVISMAGLLKVFRDVRNKYQVGAHSAPLTLPPFSQLRVVQERRRERVSEARINAAREHNMGTTHEIGLDPIEPFYRPNYGMQSPEGTWV